MKYFFSTYLPITNSQRIDIFLANLFIDMSRSYIQKLVDEGFIKVNGQVIDKNLKVKNRDIIDLILKGQQTKIEAENLPLGIIFENKAFVVI
ncbi:MAG: S4 domain-containing protein, partial [Candidatus Gracilibacteria bacterium]|nr:S4 domain-containing protein [Candidatus Gracilibacteria bacterium]